MGHTICLHCGSSMLATLLRYRSRTTFRCSDCGGFFNDPGLHTDPLYNKTYYERNYLPQEAAQLRESKWQIGFISKLISKGSVLDYGCGTGILLRTAAELGFTENVGADVSLDGLRFTRERLGDSVQLVHLPDESLPDRRFEVITLMDSLSAIRNPKETVLALKERHLAKNGIIVVRTPDLRSSYFRRTAFLSKFVGTKYGSSLMFAKARYALFGPTTLRRFVESLGLTVLTTTSRPEYRHPIHTDSVGELVQTLLLRIYYSRARSIFLVAGANSRPRG